MQTFSGISMTVRFVPHRQVIAVLASRLCALTIGAPGGRKINSAGSGSLSLSWDIRRNMRNRWSMVDADPVVMRRNSPAVTSEAYGAYSYNYAVE